MHWANDNMDSAMTKLPAATESSSENWQPQPYAERKSQHVTFGDYFQRALFHLFVGGISGTAIGWGIDILRQRRHAQGVTSFKYWGGLVGAMVGGFFSWQREEKAKLEVDQVLKEYRDLPGLLPSNDALIEDNKILKRIVEHQRQKSEATPASKVGGEHQYQGKLSDAPHESRHRAGD
jgi:hypothetical protein